jgi:hypothetical protein
LLDIAAGHGHHRSCLLLLDMAVVNNIVARHCSCIWQLSLLDIVDAGWT